jgi:hypothetical protein
MLRMTEEVKKKFFDRLLATFRDESRADFHSGSGQTGAETFLAVSGSVLCWPPLVLLHQGHMTKSRLFEQ